MSEENQGALGMDSSGQDRLTESSGSLNDVWKRLVFRIPECYMAILACI